MALAIVIGKAGGLQSGAHLPEHALEPLDGFVGQAGDELLALHDCGAIRHGDAAAEVGDAHANDAHIRLLGQDALDGARLLEQLHVLVEHAQTQAQQLGDLRLLHLGLQAEQFQSTHELGVLLFGLFADLFHGGHATVQQSRGLEGGVEQTLLLLSGRQGLFGLGRCGGRGRCGGLGRGLHLLRLIGREIGRLFAVLFFGHDSLSFRALALRLRACSYHRIPAAAGFPSLLVAGENNAPDCTRSPRRSGYWR